MRELPNSCGAAVGLLGRTLRAGDKRACEALVDAHHCALVALALSQVRSHEVADEIVQERWGGPGRHRSLPGQILAQDLDPAILVDAAITRGGREARVIAADWSALPEEALLGREMVDVVKRAIEERPVAHRRVIAMRDIAGLGADGVCEALGLSAADQRVLLHRARSRVRAPLEVHRDG